MKGTVMTHPQRIRTVMRQLAMGLCITPPLLADSLRQVPTLPAYTQECSACHMAYPPQLLPAPSWNRLMKGLDKHYGSDASLDTETLSAISRWLQTHAGQNRRTQQEPPEDRITRSDWFERKHRKISAATFQRPAIQGRGQCMACHRDAAKGDFEEDRVRIPK